MKNYLLYIALFFCFIQQSHSQDGVVSFSLPVRNSLKFNKYAINPTFSFVREQNKYITFTNKRQWAQFDNAPQTYLFSYSGRYAENKGVGVGLFQQNYGVLTTFGGVLNYAHNAVLNRDSNLTFGMNLGVYKSGINQGNVITNFPDPSLDNIPTNTLFTVNPGINYGTTFLDFGVSLSNLVLYNLKTSTLIKDNPNQNVQAHVMYTGFVDSRGFFDESKFSGLIRSEFSKDETIISGVMMFTTSNGLWAQAGYNTLYGVSGGLGINISNQIAVEYNFEKSIGDLSNFGNSHEITLAYKFKRNERFIYNDDEDEGALFNSKSNVKSKVVKSKNNSKKPTVSASARAEAQAKAKAIAEEKARVIAEKAKTAAEAKAKLAVEEKAKTEEKERLRIAEENKIKLAAQEAQAKAEEVAKAKLVAQEKAKSEEEARIRLAEENRIKLAAQEAQAKAEEVAKAKLVAQEKAKAEEEARLRLAEENRIKLANQEAQAKADAEAKAKLVAQEKAKAEEEARIRLAEENRIKLATQEAQAKADTVAKAKLAAEEKAKAEEEARIRLAEENRINLAAQEAQAKAEEAAKVKAAAEAKEKLEAENARIAEENRLRLAAIEAQAKAEEEARLKLEAQTKAALESKTRELTEKEKDTVQLDGVLVQVARDREALAMESLTKLTEDTKIKQQELLLSLIETVAVKKQDLKDLKDENDRSEQGIYTAPKPFKSVTAENAAIESLKIQLDDAINAQNIKISELENLYNERLKNIPNTQDSINMIYLNEIEILKKVQSKTIRSKASLASELEMIKTATEIERKRRIKRAAYDNEQDRLYKDVAALNIIKQNTPLSTTPLKEEDFDFGEEQNNIQIVKDIKNVESGYYIVLAVHSDVAKRDEFLTKVVSTGESNINFFYDVNTSKYYIYYQKFDDIGNAQKALQAKGSKPYNSKMAIVKIENL